MSAIRGEGQYRGPIQIQSNASADLEAIDLEVAEEVMRAGCITNKCPGSSTIESPMCHPQACRC